MAVLTGYHAANARKATAVLASKTSFTLATNMDNWLITSYRMSASITFLPCVNHPEISSVCFYILFQNGTVLASSSPDKSFIWTFAMRFFTKWSLPKLSANGWALGTIFVGLAAFAQPALADFFVTNVAFTVPNPNTIFISNTADGSSGYQDVYDGQLTFTTGPGSQAGAPATVPVWCVDIYHDIWLGNQTPAIDYTIGTLTTDHDGTDLTQTQINAISWLIVAGEAYLLAHPSPDVSGAIQLAIWKLDYGAAYGGTGFSYTGASSANMVALANIYASNAWNHRNNSFYDQYVYTLDNPNYQSFATGSVPGGSGLDIHTPQLLAVPEPATLGIFGTGLLVLAGFGVFRRRRTHTLA